MSIIINRDYKNMILSNEPVKQLSEMEKWRGEHTRSKCNDNHYVLLSVWRTRPEKYVTGNKEIILINSKRKLFTTFNKLVSS